MKIEQKRLDKQNIDLKNNFQLQVEESRFEFEKSSRNYETTIAALNEAKANFKIVNKKFDERLANPVELIDARTFMNNANAENPLR